MQQYSGRTYVSVFLAILIFVGFVANRGEITTTLIWMSVVLVLTIVLPFQNLTELVLKRDNIEIKMSFSKNLLELENTTKRAQEDISNILEIEDPEIEKLKESLKEFDETPEGTTDLIMEMIDKWNLDPTHIDLSDEKWPTFTTEIYFEIETLLDYIRQKYKILKVLSPKATIKILERNGIFSSAIAEAVEQLYSMSDEFSSLEAPISASLDERRRFYNASNGVLSILRHILSSPSAKFDNVKIMKHGWQVDEQ